MDWPKHVPYFTEDDVHNVVNGEYIMVEKGVTKRSSVGWLQYLFLKVPRYGVWDRTIYNKALAAFKNVAGIYKKDWIEMWNDEQSRKKIADTLNKTMRALGYDVEIEAETETE